MPNPSDTPRSPFFGVLPAANALFRSVLSPIRPPGTLPPHVFADPKRAELRGQIAAINAEPLDRGSKVYLAAVDMVNTQLDIEGVPLLPDSHARIRDSIAKVGDGERGPTAAHVAEASTFGRQAFASAWNGQTSTAMDGAVGAVANLAGMMLSGVREHMDTKRPWSW
ncbi:hypothetical protein [Cupriavidus pauculus]|jgi:hypothetical protein|uniref:hypothetical protein n=1 Tax=Cupriavidus pauculus TaxID=82633 RepID=UPI0038574B9F